MGILNSLTDHFNKSEFSVAPNKKLKTLSKDFKKAFNLSLVFYKGNPKEIQKHFIKLDCSQLDNQDESEDL